MSKFGGNTIPLYNLECCAHENRATTCLQRDQGAFTKRYECNWISHSNLLGQLNNLAIGTDFTYLGIRDLYPPEQNHYIWASARFFID